MAPFTVLLEFLFDVLHLLAGPLLDHANHLVVITLDLLQVVVGDLTPEMLGVPAELVPAALPFRFVRGSHVFPPSIRELVRSHQNGGCMSSPTGVFLCNACAVV